MKNLIGAIAIMIVPLLTGVFPAHATDQNLDEIAVEAYIYLFPLVLMDVTRLQMTNVEKAEDMNAPMNAFAHARTYPDPSFKGVVRPNFDTLYSSLWMDLSEGPVILSVPDSQGRYYLMPSLDMWTDVQAAPGWRTTGTTARHFAYVPKGWTGELPEGVVRIEASTPYLWFIGRTKTDGPGDYEAVHAFQDGMKVTPLSQWGKDPTPVPGVVDPSVDMKTPPMKQVETMPGRQFFEYAARLLKKHPPHFTDYSQAWRLQRLGIVTGCELEFDKLDPAVQTALSSAPQSGLKTLNARFSTLARIANGWQMNTETMGVYGNYYIKRACVSLMGLGANQEVDAVYPALVTDADGHAISTETEYVLHFAKDQLPPAQAFWSVTLYDADGFAVANDMNRQNLSSWMPLEYLDAVRI